MSQPKRRPQLPYPQWDLPVQVVQRKNQPPYPQWAPPVQVVGQDRWLGFLTLVFGLATAVLFGIGTALWIGSAGGDLTGTAAPAPRVTVTQAVESAAKGGATPTEEATEREPDPTKAAYHPKPKDFKIGVKVLEKHCSGSAGCSITYQIVLSYVGTEGLPAEGAAEVTYVVTGGEHLIANTLAVKRKETVTFNDEFVDTSSSSRKLTAKVTKVTYDLYG